MQTIDLWTGAGNTPHGLAFLNDGTLAILLGDGLVVFMEKWVSPAVALAMFPKVSVGGGSVPLRGFNTELECQKKMHYFLTYEKRRDLSAGSDYEACPRRRTRRRIHAK